MQRGWQRAVYTVLAAWMATVSVAQAADGFFFQPNDRIVFLGDSITEQYQYSTDIELYLTTRFPDWNLTFINAGIGGDRAVGGANRFAAHVLAEKPTCVTINFGMNDAGYGAFSPQGNKEYVDNTVKMLQAAKQTGVRVALLSPNAVDYRKQPQRDFKLYLETQKTFYAPLKDIAAEHGASFVDQYGITRTAIERIQADQADKVVPYYDGFHTAPAGGLLMAHAILTGLKAPATVSTATIDAAAGTGSGEHCVIADVLKTANGVTFTRTDKALPLPVQADWASLLPYVNNLADLNDYRLKVNGLSAGAYAVSIDGMELAAYSAEALAQGVNLGNISKGPLFDQGQRVFQMINEKNEPLVHRRFRDVVMFNFAAPDWLTDLGPAVTERKTAELKKRMDQIHERQAKIYEAVKPMPHKFSVEKKAS